MFKSKPAQNDKNRGGKRPAGKDEEPKSSDSGWRETVESIAMAVILALLFRGFVAEAFVIPTGSMAPTLRGRHKDVQCPECGLWYQIGASQEMGNRGPDGADSSIQTGDVTAGTCPSCRFTRPVNRFERSNDGSFSGDRIIVSKFLYDFSPPQRWDVIVFKFPGNATQNYIKRLIGLPGETIRIQGGNIWVRQGKEGEFVIARKPADKLNVLLQLVSSTDHLSQRTLDAQWPLPWIEGLPLEAPVKPRWKSERTGPQQVAFSTDGKGTGPAWLRFRQLVPTADEWQDHLLATPPTRPADESAIVDIKGQLIADFCHYNSAAIGQYNSGGILDPQGQSPVHFRAVPVEQDAAESVGTHWVDDLALECVAEVQGNSGALLLDLVRAGVHHQCRIDVASGEAVLTRVDIDGKALSFGPAGEEVASVKGPTPVRGAGSYRLKLYNCDHRVLLCVNGQDVAFDGPTTYESQVLVVPRSKPDDYGDLMPAGIGSDGAAVRLSQLEVYRDVYYIAQKDEGNGEYRVDDIIPEQGASLERFFRDPNLWTDRAFLAGRGAVEFELGPDHYFPLGDNSPASQDARTWPRGARIPVANYVERDLLIGKAMFVYWPHTWNAPIPFMPNPTQMRPIR